MLKMTARRLMITAILGLGLLGSKPGAASPPEFFQEWGSSGSGEGQFNLPRGLALDAAGNVFVADRLNHRIQKFNSRGVFITAWGSSGSGNGQFGEPVGITVDGSGNVYVTDWTLHRVQKFNGVTGAYITKWGSSGSGDGFFNLPAGIATDAAGNVYVCDSGNYRIQKFSSTGTFLARWGASGSGDGQFNRPYGVTVDSGNNVYVADRFNTRIQKFTSSGGFLLKWGTPAQFSFPDGMAVGPDGDIYVGDWDLNRIQRFHPDGTPVEQWGSTGSGPGQFNNLAGVAVDAAGCVYAGDYFNNRIERFCNCDDPISVSAGFTTRVLADIPLPAVSRGDAGIALPPPGSPFPPGVYAAFSTFQTNGAGNPPDDFLYRVDFDGTVTQLLAFPRDETDPVDIEFGPGGAFGTDLYISANNYDNYQLGDFGGAILRMTPANALSVFFPNDNSLISEPAAIAFAPASAIGFPADLYVTNPNPPHRLFTITSAATAGGYNLDGASLNGLAFGPGGAFGTNLYVGTETGSIEIADNAGNRTTFVSGLGGPVLRLVFAPTGCFGPKLYALVSTGEVVAIDSAANVSTFLTGFCLPAGTWNDFAFSADGLTMYFSDSGGRRIHVIDSISPSLSTVSPWDARGQAFVVPGATGADLVTVTVRDACGSPVPGAVVAIDLSGCSGLCIDSPDGLSGVTNASGVVQLDPRVGGCADCPITITVNGVVIRTFNRVVSADWDGSSADGLVNCRDYLHFQPILAAGVFDDCTDFNGDGLVNIQDSIILAPIINSHAANSVPCLGGCVSPPSGMVGWWPLDETGGTIAYELTGNPLAHFVGGPGHAAGMVAGSLSITDQAQYAQAPSAPAMNFGTGSFTIDAWVRSSSLMSGPSVRTIVDKRAGASIPTGYSLYMYSNRLGVQLADGVGPEGYDNFNASSGTLTDGAWHHVAAVINRAAGSNGGHLYVDGLEVTTFDPTVRPNSLTNSGPLRIGQNYDGTSSSFDGQIDEVELFNRALSQTEICSIVAAQGAGKCKPTSGLTEPEPGPARELLQLSNNPLRAGSAGIHLALDAADEVDVRVFSVTGQLVRTVVSGPLEPGAHALEWDGTADDGHQLPRGLYFVRATLRQAGQAVVARLILMK